MSKPPAPSAEDRAARLAEALRANLHRRKAQARAADAVRKDEGRDDPAAG